MKKLLTEFLAEWRSTSVPNDKLAELMLAYIATNGWYLNLNTIDGLHEEHENLVKHAKEEWK
tara:strand:- start:2641 stop:2826 length:186 start_codon:yes stop_codon:yes gene_type:complete